MVTDLGTSLALVRARDHLQAFEKLTHVVNGERRIAAIPPLGTPISDLLPDQARGVLEEGIAYLIEHYGDSLPSDRRHLLTRFTVADMARKVVGVGSVGTRCWIVLLLGRDGSDPLILQAKEADESVLAPFAGASEHATRGSASSPGSA